MWDSYTGAEFVREWVDSPAQRAFKKALPDGNLHFLSYRDLARGIDIFGEPYYIIKNCHPVPFNWNGHNGINSLVKAGKLVIAKHNGSYGTYTRDEAALYPMSDIRPLR